MWYLTSLGYVLADLGDLERAKSLAKLLVDTIVRDSLTTLVGLDDRDLLLNLLDVREGDHGRTLSYRGKLFLSQSSSLSCLRNRSTLRSTNSLHPVRSIVFVKATLGVITGGRADVGNELSRTALMFEGRFVL